jgi:hypothetical protein
VTRPRGKPPKILVVDAGYSGGENLKRLEIRESMREKSGNSGTTSQLLWESKVNFYLLSFHLTLPYPIISSFPINKKAAPKKDKLLLRQPGSSSLAIRSPSPSHLPLQPM